jgi:hypothetical protein
MASEDEKALEEEFLASWDQIEKCYEFIRSEAHPRYEAYGRAMLGLIGELRQQGYDRQLRAGQTLFMFIVSRSRKHGLRSDQSRIEILEAVGGGMRLIYDERLNEKIELIAEKFALTAEFKELLQRLLTHPID